MKLIRYIGLTLSAIGLLALGLNLGIWLVNYLSGQFGWLNLNTAATEGYKSFLASWFYHKWPYYHVIGLGSLTAVVGIALGLIGKRKSAL